MLGELQGFAEEPCFFISANEPGDSVSICQFVAVGSGLTGRLPVVI